MREVKHLTNTIKQWAGKLPILRDSSHFLKRIQHHKKISAVWLQQSQNGGQMRTAKNWGQQNARTFLHWGCWNFDRRHVTCAFYTITIIILVLVISVAAAVALETILKAKKENVEKPQHPQFPCPLQNVLWKKLRLTAYK